MMFTQRSILFRDSTDVDKNKAELHLGSEHPSDLKTVSCHL